MTSSKRPQASMTGFSQTEGKIFGKPVRLELKSLNHRFLDIKMRLPRELSAAESSFRNALSGRFFRGAIEAKLEFVGDKNESEASFQANLSVAAHYYESLISLQKTLGLNDPIRTQDVLQFPDVIVRTKNDEAGEIESSDPAACWAVVESIALQGIEGLAKSREAEGKEIVQSLTKMSDEASSIRSRLAERRLGSEKKIKDTVSAKVKKLFEIHALSSMDAKSVMESRVSQELALLLERTDVEEELTRLAGHLELFQKTLRESPPAGKKLDFILQECSREANTLGNKAQDFGMSEEVVELKVQIDRIREQVMNLE